MPSEAAANAAAAMEAAPTAADELRACEGALVRAASKGRIKLPKGIFGGKKKEAPKNAPAPTPIARRTRNQQVMRAK